MKTLAFRFAATVVCLLTVLFAICASAQEETEIKHSFGCSSTQAESTFQAELNHPSKLKLVSVTGGDEIQQAQTDGFHMIYSKIDSTKYKIGRVDFYIYHGPQNETEKSVGYGPLKIYVKLTSAERVSWWKVVDEASNAPDESLLEAQFPQDDEEGKQPPAAILPATDDRTIPLFALQWGHHEQAQWSNDVEAHVLLDLRSPEPRIASDLACNSFTAFGVCGVWDAQFQDRNNYECDWAAGKDDFRCESTVWNENNKRQKKSWFELLSGKEISFSVPTGNPTTLQQFAELAERDASWRTRQIELPGLGKTSDILRVNAAHNRVVHIFGAYGNTAPFGVVFFYVILTKDSAPELGYLPALSLFADDPEDKTRFQELTFQRNVDEKQVPPTPVSEIKLGGALSFNVKELFTAPQTHIYQITASEDASRAVYWLAIDDQQPDGKTLFSITRIANNSFPYAGCATYRSEDSAAVITRQKGRNFRVLVDVEPPHTTSETSEGFVPPNVENGEKPEDQCPYSVHVEWNHKEWITDDPKIKCSPTFSPRDITIAEDGTITATPGKVDDAPR